MHHGRFIGRFSASQPLALLVAAGAGVPVEEGVVLEALGARALARAEQTHRCKGQTE